MKWSVTLRPRERRLTLIALVVIACWVLVSCLVQPLWDRVHDLQVHIETQGEKLDALSRLLEQGASIAQEYQTLSGYLETGSEEEVQGAFLNELEALSRSSNVQLNLKPRPAKRDGRVSRFEIELDVEGSQPQIIAFLDKLLAMPRLIAVERLRLSSVPVGEQLRANVVIQKLSLQQSLPPELQ